MNAIANDEQKIQPLPYPTSNFLGRSCNKKLRSRKLVHRKTGMPSISKNRTLLYGSRSKLFLLACSCFYILSSTSWMQSMALDVEAENTDDMTIIDNNSYGGGGANSRKYKKRKRRFARSAGPDGVAYVANQDDSQSKDDGNDIDDIMSANMEEDFAKHLALSQIGDDAVDTTIDNIIPANMDEDFAEPLPLSQIQDDAVDGTIEDDDDDDLGATKYLPVNDDGDGENQVVEASMEDDIVEYLPFVNPLEDDADEVEAVILENHRRRLQVVGEEIPSLVEPSPAQALVQSEERGGDSMEENIQEEFDYESYHAKHNIPLPALGTSMMGLMKTNPVASESSNHGTQTLDGNARGGGTYEREAHVGGLPRSFFQFAGTSAAMKKYAGSEDVRASSSQSRRNLLESTQPVNDKADELPKIHISTTAASSPANVFESTLSSIFKSRASFLWGSDLEEQENEEDIDIERRRNEMKGRALHKISLMKLPPPSTSTADFKTFSLQKQPPPLRSDDDLDRGRYLVGLYVREVHSHQQIIIDYGDEYQPIRVKFILSQSSSSSSSSNSGYSMTGIGAMSRNRVIASMKQYQILSALLPTSFSKATDMWSKALNILPVSDKVVPTVEECGGASIPASHREDGVTDADIVIYVSGDDVLCGGAIMHSAVCDFDQNMRPVVGNINICTNNISVEDAPDGGVTITKSTMDEYASYVTTETGRILGASTSLFRYFINPDTLAPYGAVEKSVTCVDGTEETLEVPNIIHEDSNAEGKRYFEIRTPKVVEVVRNHFDCMTLSGARLEPTRNSIGCFGGFLDGHLFFGEQASGFQVAAARDPSISPLTLSLLEDSSWYVANYRASSEIPFGRGAGCQFARGACVTEDDAGANTKQNKGFYCSEIGEMGCDPSHTFKAKCDLLHPVSSRSVFASSSDRHSADFGTCPMYIRGAIDCAGDDTDPFGIPGEYFGKSSKCFLTDQGEPMCLQSTCNETSHSIDVKYEDDTFSCTRDGEIIDTKKGLRIECPRVAAVCPSLSCPSNCSGKGVCDEDRDGNHACICDDPFDDSPGCWGEL